MEWKLELVPIPVTDIDRAKEFYRDQLGFGVDHDTTASEDLRIVQLTPTGSACSIVLGSGDAQPGSVDGVLLVVSDIQAARSELIARGVDVSGVRHFTDGRWVDGPGGDWNVFAFFKDPDGNGWMVQERPPDRSDE